MTPLVPLADPLAQPAPPALVGALLQVTFFLHVLAMNLVLGGSILALHWRFSRHPAAARERAVFLRFFAQALPVAIAATVTLGVAPLLFLQVLYGRVFFTSSILMAWFWLSVVPLTILAYYGAYLLAFRGERLGRAGRRLASAVAVLFAAIAFLQVSNASRSLRPETFLDVYRRDARGLTLNLGDPSFWPRYLHVLLGAVAVTALAVALFGVLRRRQDPAFALWAERRGITMFGVASGLNVFVGLLFLIALPRPVLERLAGADPHATGLLALAILLGVTVAGGALLALGARNVTRVTWALGALLATTLAVMLLLREEVRRITLRNAGIEPTSWFVMQWGPFAIFLACLALAVVAIAWMVRALAGGKRLADREVVP
jgi:hypothetical protein